MSNVLIATDYFYPHWTGISKSLFYLTQSMPATEFTVVTVQHEKALALQETHKNVAIIREPYLFSLSRAKYSISILATFFAQAKKHNTIFINSPCTNVLPFSIITKILGKKLIIFHQGDLILPKGLGNKILEVIFDVMSFISFSLADQVSTYTQDYAENSRVIKPFLKKFTPLLMPVIINTSSKEISPKLQSIKKLKETGKILIGFAGRFVEEKGFDVLFKAIPKVLEKHPKVHFVFAGETNMKYESFFEQHQNEAKKVQHNLTMVGLLQDDELNQFYQMIDFIVIPSRSDCFNLVQAEAMLHGKPSIVSNIPGCRFMVQSTGFGKIFEKENADDLALKIMEAIEEKDTLKINHEKVKDLLDTNKNIEKFKTCFA